MKIELVTNRLLIIALSQQRPDRDDRLRAHLYDQVRWYRQRLEVYSPQIGSELSEGIWLYRPVTALLWGIYDQATFFIADDFDAVTQIAPGVGASSRDFLICSPYTVLRGPSTNAAIWPARSLINRSPENSYKYLAIATLRLAPPVTAAMGTAETRDAIVRRLVQFMDNVNASGLRCAFSAYRCWSGPDLVLVFQTNEPKLFIEFETEVRSLSLRILWPTNPLGTLTKDQTLPARLLTIWHGATHPKGDDGLIQSPEVRRRGDRKHIRDAIDDETWSSLGDIDAVCHLRIHVGIHGPGWNSYASANPLSKALGVAFSAMDHTVLPRSLSPMPTAEVENIIRMNLRRALCTKTPITTESRATVSLEIKPGHSVRLTRLFGTLAETDEEKGQLLRKLEESLGAHPQLRITVPISITESGFEQLFLFSHGIRLLSDFCSHLLAIETRLSLSLTLLRERFDDQDGERIPAALINGYRLLEPRNTVDVLHYHRRLIRRHRLPRSQAMALHAVLEHLEEQFAQPHTADAMVGVRAFAVAAVRNLLNKEPEEVPPDVVSELVEAIEIAAQQRAHYDTSPKARVPLSGHLPYGLAQLVAIADGVVSTIFESGLVPWTESSQTPACRTLLLLRPYPAVEIQEYSELDVATISTSLINLLSPMLLLTSIFHEAGHACVTEISGSAGRVARAAIAQRRKDYELVAHDAQRDVEDWTQILGDVIPHAFLLTLGCDGDVDRFTEQFLFSNACGLQHLAGGARHLKIDEWGRTFCQLLIQRAVHQWLSTTRTRDLRDMVHEIANTELEQPRLILQHVGWWAPEIEQGTVSGTTLTTDIEELSTVFHQRFVGTLRIAALDNVVNALFWKSIENKLVDISKFRDLFPEARANPTGSTATEPVTESVAKGRVSQLSPELGLPAGAVVGWDVLNHETGKPTNQALAFVRQVFVGLQERHERLTRCSAGTQRLDRGIHRDSTSGAILGVRATRNDTPIERTWESHFRGIFSDPAGGPYICGATERLDYLASRVAALEMLSCLAGRISSALLWERFYDERIYARHSFSAHGGRPHQLLWRSQPLDTESSHDCILVDICPGAVKVHVKPSVITEWSLQEGSMLWIGDPEDSHCVFCYDVRKPEKEPHNELVLMLPRTARLHGLVPVVPGRGKPEIRRYSRSSGSGRVDIEGHPCEILDYSRIGIGVRHTWENGAQPAPDQPVKVKLPSGQEVTLQVRWTKGNRIGLSWPEDEAGRLPHLAELLKLREPAPWTAGPIGAGTRVWLLPRRSR